MAGEEEVVSGLDPPRETHEDHRVGAKSTGHGPRDDLLILFQIRDGGEGKAPVGDWSPKMSAEEVLSCGRGSYPMEESGRHVL